jgi:hypothetical protein
LERFEVGRLPALALHIGLGERAMLVHAGRKRGWHVRRAKSQTRAMAANRAGSPRSYHSVSLHFGHVVELPDQHHPLLQAEATYDALGVVQFLACAAGAG